MGNCQDNDNDAVFIRVDGEWVRYNGATSLRKIYYRAYEAMRTERSCFYLHEFGARSVTGAMFPVGFWKSLSCISMDGIDAHNLPHRIVLEKKKCKWVNLGNGCGRVCTHCGDRGYA